MNKYFSFIHKPKIVITFSLLIAVLLGAYGYIKINQKPTNTYTPPADTTAEDNVPASQNLTLGFLAGGRIKSVSVKAGDSVKKGTVLATLDAENTAGALMQAKAAYTTAEANYQKVINGATGSAIDVAKAAVNTAQVNLDGVSKQQDVLVQNARLNLLNSTLVAKVLGDTSMTPPSVTGTYTKDIEGTITITVNQGGTGGYFDISGVATGTGIVSTTIPEPIQDTGLYLEFPAGLSYIGTTWTISIPNNTAPNYLTNYNAYQTALENQTETIASTQAMLDQANASLSALAAAARPEDVAAAEAQVTNASGAVQIAEAAYQNTIITAPSDGTIVAVSITPGQIAMPNAPAIEFLSAAVH